MTRATKEKKAVPSKSKANVKTKAKLQQSRPIAKVLTYAWQFYNLESRVTLMANEYGTDTPHFAKPYLLNAFEVVSFLETLTEDYDLFFSACAYRQDSSLELTRFGWCDTGAVHPSTYLPHPIAYWQTSPGRYQAMWFWEKALPLEVSECRMEAIIREFGGNLGTHTADALLRLPGSINHKVEHDEPVVELLHNGFPDQFGHGQPLSLIWCGRGTR